MIDALASSGSYRGAEANFRPLVPYLDKLTKEEAERIAVASTNNGEIWHSGGCRTLYLPEVIGKNRHHIDTKVLQPLEFQIKHGSWFHEEAEV